MTTTTPRPTPRLVADARAEDDYCERSTQGCCIDHSAERTFDPRTSELLGCETW